MYSKVINEFSGVYTDKKTDRVKIMMIASSKKIKDQEGWNTVKIYKDEKLWIGQFYQVVGKSSFWLTLQFKIKSFLHIRKPITVESSEVII